MNKNSKNFLIITQIYFLRILILFFPLILFAKVEYIPMESNLGIGADLNTNNLSSFVSEIYNLGIAIAVVLAVLVIMYSGIEYIITDNSGKKGVSLERVQGALIGLGLALASYLILDIINPQILDLENNKIINPQ
jgi:hypothetical protein